LFHGYFSSSVLVSAGSLRKNIGITGDSARAVIGILIFAQGTRSDPAEYVPAWPEYRQVFSRARVSQHNPVKRWKARAMTSWEE